MEKHAIVSVDHFTRAISVPAEDGKSIRSHQVAGAGARFLAGLLDLFVQVVGFAGIAWLAVGARPDLFPPESWTWAVPVGLVEWHIIYLMLFEGFTRGTTPGKRVIGLRVVQVSGATPRPVALVVRNVGRVLDLLAGAYAASFILAGSAEHRQRLGDLLAKTLVIYRIPLTAQLAAAEVPESIYSTSEDGYLLESWVERGERFDTDSQLASAIDLAVYLRGKYEPDAVELPDPASYLQHLYETERGNVVETGSDADSGQGQVEPRIHTDERR